MYPILFTIPGLGWPIYAYGVALGASIIQGWYFTLYLGAKDGLPRRVMGNCYFLGIAASLAGARLLYLLTNPDQFNGIGDIFQLREGGLVAYGGFLGGVLGSWAYMRSKGIRFWAWADVTAAPIALGLALTRGFGCFLYGCCYGRRVTDADPGWLQAIAIRFPNWAQAYPHLAEHGLHGAPAFTHHVRDLGLEAAAAASYPIAPSQLIASINGFLAVGLILLVRKYRTARGQMFLTFGLYYGLTRFLFEILRDDTQRGTIGPPVLGWFGGFEGALTTSQAIGVVTVLLCIGGLIYFHRLATRDPEAAMALGPGAAVKDEQDAGEVKRSGRSKRPGRKKRKK